jgi:electron transfer flavoprotein alpha subunit
MEQIKQHHNVRRINPRRPYVISANGLKRIILGTETGLRDVHLTRHAAAKKTFRTTQTCTRYLMAVMYSDRGMLDEHAKESIAAAALLADQQTAVVVVVLGSSNAELGELGADIVIQMPQLDTQHFAPEKALALLGELIAQYQPLHLFMPDRYSDGDLGRRLSVRTQKTIATDVVELAADYALRAIPGNNYARCALPQIVLLARHAVDTNLPFIGHGLLEQPAISITPHLSTLREIRDLGIEASAPGSIGLEEADFIMSAGNGMRDMTSFAELAKLFGASVGASRVAVDDGRFSRDKQVGATGKTVQASMYMAFGISGAVQHLQGIKDCRHVIAVNLDESAPIAKRANLTVVEDTQALMRALITQIAQVQH